MWVCIGLGGDGPGVRAFAAETAPQNEFPIVSLVADASPAPAEDGSGWGGPQWSMEDAPQQRKELTRVHSAKADAESAPAKNPTTLAAGAFCRCTVAADRASEALRNAISGQTRRWHESGGKCWTDLNHDTWVFIASKLDGVEGLLSLSHVS